MVSDYKEAKLLIYFKTNKNRKLNKTIQIIATETKIINIKNIRAHQTPKIKQCKDLIAH